MTAGHICGSFRSQDRLDSAGRTDQCQDFPVAARGGELAESGRSFTPFLPMASTSGVREDATEPVVGLPPRRSGGNPQVNSGRRRLKTSLADGYMSRTCHRPVSNTLTRLQRVRGFAARGACQGERRRAFVGWRCRPGRRTLVCDSCDADPHSGSVSGWQRQTGMDPLTDATKSKELPQFPRSAIAVRIRASTAEEPSGPAPAACRPGRALEVAQLAIPRLYPTLTDLQQVDAGVPRRAARSRATTPRARPTAGRGHDGRSRPHRWIGSYRGSG